MSAEDSFLMDSWNKDIKKLTSCEGLNQFSVLKANNVKKGMFNFWHCVMTILTDSKPFLWPEMRGIRRFLAHLPFPSIITAICLGFSNSASLADNGRKKLNTKLRVIQILLIEEVYRFQR